MGRRIERVPARPFAKFVGGKSRLVPELLARTPKDIKTYYEPFVGGGALFFALASRRRRRFERAYLTDTNARLMRTYAAITTHAPQLIRVLAGHALSHQRAPTFYNEQRARDIDVCSDVNLAAWFIYLNKTCFNGLYRVNKQNVFNVPMGSYAKPNICDADNLRRCSMALANNVYTGLRDFSYVKQAKPGDFAYFDPPYYPLTKTSNFTSYGADGFGDADHVRLRDLAIYLKTKGVRVLLSNSNAPRVRELYAPEFGFTIEEVQAARAINSKGDKRGKITELLIT